MNDNQMKPLQALEILMTRVQPSEDNVEKARVEYETVKSALKEHELMKNTKIIVADNVADKKISEDDIEKLKNLRMFVGKLEQCEIKPLFDEETTKKLKALEIIKEKEVNIQNFKVCLFARWEYELFEEYCLVNNPYDEHPAYVYSMTKEQFEIVKEVLEND